MSKQDTLKTLQLAANTLDDCKGNVDPELGFADELESDVVIARDTLLAHIKHIESEIEQERQADAKYVELMRIGKCAADSIRDMVAALNCDYDRLQELDTPHNNRMIKQLRETDEATELVALRKAAGDCKSRDDAVQRIQEDALSVEVRGDWYTPGGDGDDGVAVEFKILLSTGGPATRIMGELCDGEPDRAWLEVQHWGTPWTNYYEEGLGNALLAYARCFYFGEG